MPTGGYTRKQAVRVAQATAEHDVTWFEEPVSSDDLTGLKEVRDQVRPDVTAGEYGFDLGLLRPDDRRARGGLPAGRCNPLRRHHRLGPRRCD